MYRGEWWRMLTTFFYMGDQLMSIFFWMQIYHFWDCLKVLELVKYHWEPSAFVKMITCNAAALLVLKQFRRETIFLSSPLVMTFMYMYSREYEAQPINFLGFFQIRCGWLPFVQMAQDLIQAGDIVPNLLGLFAGHLYYYAEEVAPRLLMPEALPTWREFWQARVRSGPAEGPDGTEQAATEEAADAADTPTAEAGDLDAMAAAGTEVEGNVASDEAAQAAAEGATSDVGEGMGEGTGEGEE